MKGGTPPQLIFCKVIILCQAILFDLDGVLVSSTASVERVWRKWAEKYQLDPEYVIEMAHGRRTVETVRAAMPMMRAEQAKLEAEKLESAEVNDKEGIVAIPGAVELLRSLPVDRYTVVTSGTRALATARMGYAGIPAPKAFVTADDVVNGKPDPEPYRKGAMILGFSAEDCVVFEDTPAGIEAGKSAGMRVIALTTTYPASHLIKADAVLDSFAVLRVSFTGSLRLELP